MGFYFGDRQPKTSVEVLAMVRHGDYEKEKKYNWRDGSLLPIAVEEVTKTGNLLKQCLLNLNILEHGKTIMVTSDKVRARETAEILKGILGLECIVFSALGLNDRGDGYSVGRVLKDFNNLIIPNGGYQGLVVVTHEEQTKYLPPGLHSKVNGDQPRLYYGNAAVYDPNGQVQFVSPSEIF